MYNPDSFEGIPALSEWIELYNATAEPVDLAGWYVEDDLARGGDFPSYVLGPQETVAVIPSGGDAAQFVAAWNAPLLQVTTNGETSAGALVGFNLGNALGDRLRLVRPGGPPLKVADAVYYGNGGDWPDTNSTGLGSSIYVAPPATAYAAEGNDAPAAWRASTIGTNGAYAMNTDPGGIYNGADMGSPGHVEGVGLPPCPAPADQTGDGVVNLADFAHLLLCFRGPAVAAPGNCDCFDADSDGRVDLGDLNAFQRLFTIP
jgi:hypothetical protein